MTRYRAGMPATDGGPTLAEPRLYAEALAEDLDEELHRSLTEPSAPAAELPADRFLDRESSRLEFNARVLDLARDPHVPLLDRVRFLALFATNLDDFFMVRVAGLKQRLASGIATRAPSGLTVRDQLGLIAQRGQRLAMEHAVAFRDEVRPVLAEQGIEVVRWGDVSTAERQRMGGFFRERVYPVLTPLAVDPAHPFPYISGLSLNLAVIVRDRDSGREHFARVKVPPILPRLVPLGRDRFLPLEDVMAAHLGELFPGMDVLETHNFRLTRNQDLEVEEAEDGNLLQTLERELLRRRFGPPVRLEVDEQVSDRVLGLLVRELQVGSADVYRIPGPLDLSALTVLADLDRPQLRYPALLPCTAPSLRESGDGICDIFATLRRRDVLVHHPYESFSTSVQAFVEQAAADPNVLAIKQTLYRTSGDSPIVDALIDAAEGGKQVLVSVEIKARFDEQANIRWARALERAGSHVVYGVVGLKTHCKLCLVIRQEPDGTLRRYSHVGTGNYNPRTARVYEDLGLLTADEEVGRDLTDLFNHLSGYTRHRDYRMLLVAPESLRRGLVEMIDREAEHARAGRPCGITWKVNNLVDEQVVDALYLAAQAGVPIQLVVRGMCALRPGVPGLSGSVEVRSIVGRFLEHSRVLRLVNGGQEECWLGSADVMHRNLDRRVEAMVRVRDPAAGRRLGQLLDLAMADDLHCWRLQPDGEWQRSGAVDYQLELMRRHANADAEDRPGQEGSERSTAGGRA